MPGGRQPTDRTEPREQRMSTMRIEGGIRMPQPPPALIRPEGELFVIAPFAGILAARMVPICHNAAPEMPDMAAKITSDSVTVADGPDRPRKAAPNHPLHPYS